ncbi:MAG: hypothetical protein WC938_02670 [Candidatus Paceibacterota bacterium]|jgi:hypothetical protein
MNVAEQLGDVIGVVDINPKLPICIDELPVPDMSIYLYIEGRKPKAYYINYLLENKEADDSTKMTAIHESSFGARLRAQVQFPDMELFPSVEVKNIGNLRNSVFQLLEEGSRSDEFIDCSIFSRLACSLYKKGGKYAFPTIRRLVPKDAKYIAQTSTNLKIEI